MVGDGLPMNAGDPLTAGPLLFSVGLAAFFRVKITPK
jgi:hypothetical protein